MYKIKMLQYKVGEDAEQVKTHILLVGMQNNTAYPKMAWKFLIKKKIFIHHMTQKAY